MNYSSYLCREKKCKSPCITTERILAKLYLFIIPEQAYHNISPDALFYPFPLDTNGQRHLHSYSEQRRTTKRKLHKGAPENSLF